jgi:biopolymer transport protein ExbB
MTGSEVPRLKSLRRFLGGAVLVCLATFPADAAKAKAAPPAVQQASADEPPVDDATILDWINKSGWSGYVFMVALGLFSVMAVAVTLERLVNLRRERLLPAEFVRQYRTVIQNGERDPAAFRALCESFTAPVAVILKAGVLRAGRPLPEVEKAMEDAAVRESSAIRSRVRPLSVIASVAPLVGLLGTVVGMILAFHTTSQAATGSNKGELLAEGIYLALLTTAAGLTIAIPAMLFAAYFNSRLERFLREIDEQLMDAMPAFAAMEQQDGVQLLPSSAKQPRAPKFPAVQNS